ncbi:MAG: hypothetical protein R6U19_09165 [Bacteroidales bacterium]
MRPTIKLPILLPLIMLLSTGCQKEEDNERPVVKMISPGPGSYYSVPDTIEVIAEISDDQNIEWIELSLINREQQPVAKTKSIKDIHKKQYKLQAEYVVDDILLPGGEYYIQVKASDGQNTKNGQQKVYINEADKILEHYIVVTRSNPNQVSIYRLDTAGNSGFLFSEPIDYLDSEFIPYNQQLILSGHKTYDVKAFHAGNYEHAWNIPVVANPPEPCFTALGSTKKEILLGYYDGKIHLINHKGKKTLSLYTPGALYPYRLSVNGNYLLSAQQNIPKNERYLVSYFLDGGGVHRQMFIDFDVQSLFNQGEHKFFITGNHASSAGIWLYNLNTQNLWNAMDFDESKIRSSCQISQNDYLLSGTQNLYWYQVASNSLTIWKTGFSAEKLYYEPLTNSVLAISGKTIHLFDFPISSLKKTLTLSEEIFAVHPVYNK